LGSLASGALTAASMLVVPAAMPGIIGVPGQFVNRPLGRSEKFGPGG